MTTPTIRAWPPGGVTLTGLKTYFAATAEHSAIGTVGGQGYTLKIQVAAQTYDWDFGDGTTASGPGGPPATGTVFDTYSSVGSRTTTVRVAYGATYSVLVPGGGVIGPLAVTGGAVRTLPASTTFAVREAYAGLTR